MILYIAAEIEITNLEKALTSADNKIIDLEAENKNVKDERDRHMEKAKVGHLEHSIFFLLKF